jgi:hypothetical protein
MHPALRFPYKIVDRVAPLQAFCDKVLKWRQSSTDSSSTATRLDIACDIEALVQQIQPNQPKHLGSISLIQLCAPAVDEAVNIVDVLTLNPDVVKAALRPIMEDGARFRKIMFDCRRDVEALSGQLQIRPRCVLDLQLMYAGHQWKQRASDRRSGLPYVLKQELGIDRQAGDAAVSRAMLLGNRPVWDVRPLPEHFLDYAADDVRHLFALYDVMRLRHAPLVDASERITEEYVNFYAQGRPVEEEADPKSHNVRTEWLERYFGPASPCGFCGQRGHHESGCFRRQAAVAAASQSASTSAAGGGGQPQTASSSPPAAAVGGKSALRCSFCNSLGHTATHCYKKNPQLLACKYCGQHGHSEAHCFMKEANRCKHCGGKHPSHKCLKKNLMPASEGGGEPQNQQAQ